MTESKNKQKVDILADLFEASTSESTEGLEKLKELAYRKRPPTGQISGSESPGVNPGESKGKSQLKGGLSYSISKRRLVENGAPKVKIKIVIPKTIEHQVSMPKIVDYAIESFLEELKSAVDE